ncbi:MAG: hypothetical protein C5B50_06785 [Verrucomicrobia bacterium]|nr:MAG: hypothetical protein C5B50_06785 [Verrucomicrobiota bacterium]
MNRPANYRPRSALARAFIITPWLLLAPAARGDDSIPLSAKVIKLVGEARYQDKKHPDWHELRAGYQLAGEWFLQTDMSHSTGVDIELGGSSAGGRMTVHIFSSTILKLIGASSNKSGSVESRNIRLDLRSGQIRISLDGISDYSFTLIRAGGPVHLTVARSNQDPKETIFVFGRDLTVLKGAVTTSMGTGTNIVIHAGEQLGVKGASKTPTDAPELKLGQ